MSYCLACQLLAVFHQSAITSNKAANSMASLTAILKYEMGMWNGWLLFLFCKEEGKTFVAKSQSVNRTPTS